MIGRETIWVLADRRLTFKNREPRDDAVKLFDLATDDGRAILAYSGLGITPGNTETSTWMSSVLRAASLDRAILAGAGGCGRTGTASVLGDGSVRQVILAPSWVGDAPVCSSLRLSAPWAWSGC